MAMPANTSTRNGMASMAIEAKVTSRRPIFLPSSSGVRPTIRPARNTATMANTRIE